jgi:hypothetical protein
MYRFSKSLAALAGPKMGSLIHRFAKVIQYPPIALSILLLATPAVALGERDLGGCTTSVEQGRLLVIGNEIANVIEIVGSEGGVQVTCDGSSDTFDRIDTITVEAGDGNDEIRTDNSNSRLSGIAMRIFGQAGEDRSEWGPALFPLLPFIEQDGLYDGGAGEDTMRIVTGLRADRFTISGPQANSVQVQVTDIATETRFAQITGSGVEVLKVKMGEGNDQAIISQIAGIALNILGQGGDDLAWFAQMVTNIVDFRSPDSYEGGTGNDVLLITSGVREDKFDIAAGPERSSVEVRVTDIATQTALAHISGSALEVLTVKMSDGNDQANIAQLTGITSNVFGQGGDDSVILLLPLGLLEPFEIVGLSLVDLGLGYDKFFLVGAPSSESYEIIGVPGQESDPEIRVTDLVTGEVTADLRVQHAEEIMLEAEDGDDRVEVNCDAALMSGLSFIRADLGRGNDMFISNLLPVLTEPPTHEVQTARFEVDAGRGNDQVTFNHSAGSWFDVFFTVDLGLGTDTVNALLEPPPDVSFPGPEGLRQLQFNVFAGANDDFVGLQNRTNGDLFDVSLYTELGGGNDTFEGVGEIRDANISPGRGFDTARVTRNFLPFVTTFESIEVLEGSP